MIRNNKSHRNTEANKRKTEAMIEAYQGKIAVLNTWEKLASDDLQIKEHDYLLELRRQIRNKKNYILHRADPDAEI